MTPSKSTCALVYKQQSSEMLLLVYKRVNDTRKAHTKVSTSVTSAPEIDSQHALKQTSTLLSDTDADTLQVPDAHLFSTDPTTVR